MNLPDVKSGTPPAQPLSCTSCAGGNLQPDRVKLALWQGEDLLIVEDIPALVCQSCGERYFEDETAMSLDMMREGRGMAGAPARTMQVPVYAFAAPARRGSDGGAT
ncbi:MAG: type II toxin-antitoxin system MqsA family antitoxin [Roseovarius sp.]